MPGGFRKPRRPAPARLNDLHHGQLGSMIAISYASGQPAEQRAYRPFGKVAKALTMDITRTGAVTETLIKAKEG